MPLLMFGVWLLGALLSFSSVVRSRDADPTGDFCSLSSHMMAQKDGILYIVGGRMVYPYTYSSYDGPNPVLRSLNISKSFSTSTDSVNYIRTEEVPGAISGIFDAAFFPTETGFDLTFGAWKPYNNTIYGKRDPPMEDKKWQYDIAARRWTNKGIILRNWFQMNTSRKVSSSMTSWIPSLKKGFLFGGSFFSTSSVNGTSLKVTEIEEHNGLIIYDQATNTWTNKTAPFGGISEGGLVHITTATDEVLIQFGGRSGSATSVRQFSEINIYSTNRSKWYAQRLPLDAPVPDPRFAFCTALKSASDGSSHQIYVMGGLEAGKPGQATGGLTARSIWVLSIPSFEWARLPDTSKTPAADPSGRISPKCHPIGEHYIFYYGGKNAVKYSSTITCDQKANAVFLFDVNTLTWTNEFTPNEGTYEIPSQVIELIGGYKNGCSTKEAPAKGWSDPDLETIMRLKPAKTWDDCGSTSPPETHPPTPNPIGRKLHGGAIAGGTAAGIVAVALGILGAIIFRNRRERRNSQRPEVGRDRVKAAELPAVGAYTGHGGGGGLVQQ